MEFKNSKGFVGTDIIISIIAIVLFSSLILALILNNSSKSVKLYKDAQATIYLTETLENIGNATYVKTIDYEDEYDLCKPTDATDKKYKITINKPETLGENDIIQKISVDIEYNIGDKTYKQTMTRTKIKE